MHAITLSFNIKLHPFSSLKYFPVTSLIFHDLIIRLLLCCFHCLVGSGGRCWTIGCCSGCWVWAAGSDWLIGILKSAIPNFLHILPQNEMNIHVWMIAFSVHVGCSALNIFKEGVTTSSQKCNNNIAIAWLCCLHQWRLFADGLCVDIDRQFLLRLHSHLQQKCDRCLIRCTCRMMQRSTLKLVHVIIVRLVLVNYFK